jgi:hypothetical protein
MPTQIITTRIGSEVFTTEIEVPEAVAEQVAEHAPEQVTEQVAPKRRRRTQKADS